MAASSQFTDTESTVRCKALEVFVRRSYRTFGVAKDSKVKVASSAVGVLGARWQFRRPGVCVSGNGSKGMHKWQGSAKVVPDRKALEAFLTTDLNIDTGKEEKANEAAKLFKCELCPTCALDSIPSRALEQPVWKAALCSGA